MASIATGGQAAAFLIYVQGFFSMAPGTQGKPLGCISVLVLLTMVTWFSNPDIAVHRQALRTELQQRVDREIERQGFVSGSLLWLTKDAMVDMVVDGASYTNYGLASITKYEDEQLTVGIWGQVFVVAKDRSATPRFGTKHP